MGLEIYEELEQGSDAWLEARRGLLTASQIKLILTPKGMRYSPKKSKGLLATLAAQRISGVIESEFVSNHMLRGSIDEVEAKLLYALKYNETQEIGFVTNDKWGFKLGFSPDAFVGDDGLIECKSRLHKYQVETILSNSVPEEYLPQIHMGMMVSERKWCDFVSYSAGLPMFVQRVYASKTVKDKLLDAAEKFHNDMDKLMYEYEQKLQANAQFLTPTVRKVEKEIFV